MSLAFQTLRLNWLCSGLKSALFTTREAASPAKVGSKLHVVSVDSHGQDGR